MKAKNKEIRDVVSVLCGINISKVSDLDIQTTLYDDYVLFRKIFHEVSAAVREIKEKFRKENSEEFRVVGKLREKNLPVEGHEEFLAAEEAAVNYMNKKWDEESEVAPKLIPFNSFVECVKNDLTLEQVAILKGFVIE